MMKYMLLIHGDEVQMNAATPPGAGMSPDFTAYHEAMAKAGIIVSGERLRPTTEAASIRVTGDKTEVLDGPYAETKEQLGGYYVIDVADMDQAIAWAARCPSARNGTIEVRPIWPTRPE
jgi:hypothetical protein